MNRTLIYGHRGNCKNAPENSLASFQLCLDDNIDGIELDIHLCKTGQLMVFHDFSLKRITGLPVDIEDTDYDTLRKLNIGKGQIIPTLDEVFDLCNHQILFDVELKSPVSSHSKRFVEMTWDTIKNHKMENLVSVSSFNPLTLRNFNKVSHHKIETADIYARTKGVPKILQTGNGRFISHSTYLKPRYDMIDSLYMKKYGKRKKIVAWTVNSAQTAQRMSNLGVYAVISNNPSYIKGVLDGPTVL